MLRRFANLLRRIANAIDFRPSPDPVTPLEFISSVEIADELRRRNDAVVIFYGRGIFAGDRWWLDGALYFKCGPDQFQPLFRAVEQAVADRIGDHD